MRLGERILALDDRPTKSLFVPEWNEAIWLRPITGLQRERFSRLWDENPDEAKALLVVYSACDEQGEALWNEQDAKALAGKNSAAIERLFVAALAISKLRAEDIEELEKNSLNGAAITTSIST